MKTTPTAAPQATPPDSTSRRTARLTLRLALAGALGVAAIWTAVAPPDDLVRWWNPGSRPELHALVTAVGTQRIVEGRLSGGFAWGPRPAVTRGATTAATATTASTTAASPMARVKIAPDAQIAAARLAKRVERDRTATTLAALGTAYLATGQIQPAVDALEEAVALDARTASTWSDLSAAYLAAGAGAGSGAAGDRGASADAPRALEAAERALAVSAALPEARFNRALALEQIGLAQRTADAWRGYLDVDPNPAWAAEAHARLAELEARQRSSANSGDLQTLRERLFDDLLPRWAALAASSGTGSAEGAESAESKAVLAEASQLADRLTTESSDRFAADVLARVRERERARESARGRGRDASALGGYIAYGQARRLYKTDRMDAAAIGFDDAVRQLEREDSPLALSARLHRAIVAYRTRDAAGAAQQLSALLPRATRPSYSSLVGRIAWTLGVLAAQRGAYVESAGFYRLALPAFDQAGEAANGAFVHMLVADNYERRGELERGWPDLRLALAGSRREGVLLRAAQWALRMNWSYVAAILQDEAATIARAGQRATNIVDALRVQALTDASLGRAAEASRLIAEARAILAKEHDSTWDRLRAEVDLVDARIATAATAPAGIASADRAQAYFTASRAPGRLPQVLLARARLQRFAGRIDMARQDLATAADMLSGEGRALAPGPERLVFAETVRLVSEEVVSLEMAAGQPERALAEADRLRSWDLSAGPPAGERLDLARLRETLSRDTVVAYYSVGETESFVWVIRRDGVRAQRLDAQKIELQRLVAATRPEDLDSSGMRRLYELVLKPIAGTLTPGGRLVVVPDGPLHALPFAALPGRTARYLIEEQMLSQSPSLSALAATSQRLREMGRDARAVLAVGDPRIDPDVLPGLAPLKGAVTEARDIARVYPASTLLIGDRATSETVLAALPAADVLHFAGHAIVNDLYPADSQLGLMNRDGQALTAAAVSALALPRLRLAVLAACQGLGGGAPARGQGSMSVARAFLQAGVPSVLANRWLVDDEAAVALSVAFHQRYAQGGDAAAALRQAQLSMIRSGDARLSAPRAWAGWTLVGGVLPAD
jgi:CHAT domain-containing protein